MKKLLVIVLTLSLTAWAFAGCGDNGNSGDVDDNSKSGVKTGLGVVSTIVNSTPPKADKNGEANAESVVAALTIDSEGKIIKCKIDGTQTKISFTDNGKIFTPKDSIYKSKYDLGNEYGMKGTSSIGKEWNEQADAFSEYCQGKTVEDITGIAVNKEGVPTDKDLTGSVTIHVGDFIKAVEKAAAGAKELGAGASDKLGLAVETNISHSKDATSDEDGLAQAYTNYVAVTVGDDEAITSSFIEGAQSDVNFDNTGKITSDLKAELKTKRELGTAYGLAEVSEIGKEWNEQADSFSEYIKGMTTDKIEKVKINKDGVPEEEDLSSSVTMNVADYISLIEKAAEKAS